jgi:hypothetical protein
MVAALATLGYGAAGFWMLDEREFGYLGALAARYTQVSSAGRQCFRIRRRRIDKNSRK